MFEQITFESILQRMLERVPNTLDKREGSVIYDALAPAAVELKLAYIELDQVLNESFADTASRTFLIRRCAERGITPHEATKAVLKGEFTPTDVDLIGERFNLDKLNYEVIEKISDGVYKLECETAGAEGNQQFGTLIPIEYIDGLQTAELTELLIPGEDEESNESLRTRYLESFQELSFGGNRQDYLNKVNSIPGVGAVKVTPIWEGAGTVEITIINSDYRKASDELVDTVQQLIDPSPQGEGYGIAPIGHTVTVDTVDEIDIDIVSTITFDTGYSWESLQTAINAAMDTYMIELCEDWGNQNTLIVRIAQIESKLMQIDGIIDVENTTINGEAANYELYGDEIPVLNSVSGGDD